VFSSADLPAELDERTRFSRWTEVMTQIFGRRHVVGTVDRPFSARSELVRYGSVALGRHEATLAGTDRTSADVAADGVDNFMLTLNPGTARIAFTQRGRQTILAPGSWTLLSLAEVASIRWEQNGTSGHSEWLNAVIPRRQILELVGTADDLVVMPIDAGRPAVQHLRQYVRILFGPDGLSGASALAAHIGTTLLDLIALSLGAEREAAELARMRGLRAARLQEIVAEIKARFVDPTFSPADVARKLGLSVRYIQNLMQQSGSSFTEQVLELRLQKARTMLTDRRHDRLKVSDIAAASGFNEVSHFNRCFRRRFGASPSNFRGAKEV
jgi:AraC-like DNA-binding protein